MSEDLQRILRLAGIEPLNEKAPKGWEGTVKAMKKHPEIDNPWALAHYMKNKGYKSHKKEESVDIWGEGIEEKAPPGMEDEVMRLKDQYGHDKAGMSKAFATAWSIYNKKHGKTEECSMAEEINGTPDVKTCNQSNPENARAACHMEESMDDEHFDPQWSDRLQQLIVDQGMEDMDAVTQVAREMQEAGVDIDVIHAWLEIHGESGEMDGEPMGSFDSSDDAEALASAGHGSDEDYGFFGGDEMEEEYMGNPDKFDDALEALVRAMKNPHAKPLENEAMWIAKSKNVSFLDLMTAYQHHAASPRHAFEEDFDLNNGYDDEKYASQQDYFPTGFDGPVVTAVGPSAKQGDNPEQKRFAGVAKGRDLTQEGTEIHKELVYRYRDYLKESSSKKN